MARQGQGDENGDGNDDWPWFWYFYVGAALCYSLLCVAERLSYLLLRIAEQWQRLVEDRQRSRTGTLLSVPTSQVAQPCSRPIGGVPLPYVGNTDGDGTWYDIDSALERGTAPDHLVILVNIDPIGRCNVPLAEQVPEVQAPLQDIDDIDPADPAEDDLALLLRLGQVVGLPRQIERDEANMVGRPQVPQPIAEVDSIPLILVPDVADGVSQNLLIPPAVQQALESADKAVESASREVEPAVLQVQDEANTVNRPQVPRTSTSEGALVPPELVGGVAVRGSEHLPTVLQGPESVAADALEDNIDADDAAEEDIDAVDALTSEILAGKASEHGFIPVEAPEPEVFAAFDSPPVSFGGDAPGPDILAIEASEHAVIPVDATEPGTDGLEPAIGAAGNSAIAALDHPQHFETNEASTNLLELKKVEDEVGEPSVQRIIQLASSDGDPGHARVATASLSVPAGDLNSHLEVQMPSAVTKGGVTEAEATLLEEN